ncbi:hypothetical protein NCLIV_020980 [Neospora caninum Liverpool]|uniref:PHD-finger domain-containing protein n=1 Tax=Neospora caninum (strain Liverpool) TaxID=572307 RepID=F0VF17_NEOCL|nr:hypothetical protein NCLIV_020980 [Neospora caninum Liverpool]CBZ52311.1 hypothetical protein NCLIV_020980 [Neospora caninum Liverpool]CEL66280.1 TPA: PHD-finger domain-containing protein [Neospora caninum Liverpool]|eukprot:XP_003882343.1 hypothetical protein NCLIV_020980 [Neospora caninum Liverpool]
MSLELQFKHPSLPYWLPVNHPLLPSCLHVSQPVPSSSALDGKCRGALLESFRFSGTATQADAGEQGLHTRLSDPGQAQKEGGFVGEQESKARLKWASARSRCACSLVPPQETLQSPDIDLLRLGPSQQIVFGRKPGLDSSPVSSLSSTSIPSLSSSPDLSSFAAFRFAADPLYRTGNLLAKPGDVSRPRAKLRRSAASQGSPVSFSEAENFFGSQPSDRAESSLPPLSSGRRSEWPNPCSRPSTQPSDCERSPLPCEPCPAKGRKVPIHDDPTDEGKALLSGRSRPPRHSEDVLSCWRRSSGSSASPYSEARERVSPALRKDGTRERPASLCPVQTVYLPSLDPLLSRQHFCVTRIASGASEGNPKLCEAGESSETQFPRFVLTSKAAAREATCREGKREDLDPRAAAINKTFEQGLQGLVLVNSSSALSAPLDLRSRLGLLAPTVRAAVEAAIDASEASEQHAESRFFSPCGRGLPPGGTAHARSLDGRDRSATAPGSNNDPSRAPRCTYTHFVYQPHFLQDGDQIYIPVDDAFLKKPCKADTLGSAKKENCQRLSNASTGTEHDPDRPHGLSRHAASGPRSSTLEMPSTSVCRSCGEATPLFCFRYVFHAAAHPSADSSRPMLSEASSLSSAASSLVASSPPSGPASTASPSASLPVSVESSFFSFFESHASSSPLSSSAAAPTRSSASLPSTVSAVETHPLPGSSSPPCGASSLSSPSPHPARFGSSIAGKLGWSSADSHDRSAPRWRHKEHECACDRTVSRETLGTRHAADGPSFSESRPLPEAPLAGAKAASAVGDSFRAGLTDRTAEGDGRKSDGDDQEIKSGSACARARSWRETIGVGGETESSDGSQETVEQDSREDEANSEERAAAREGFQGEAEITGRRASVDRNEAELAPPQLQRTRGRGDSDDVRFRLWWRSEKLERPSRGDGSEEIAQALPDSPGAASGSYGQDQLAGGRRGGAHLWREDVGFHGKRERFLETAKRSGEREVDCFSPEVPPRASGVHRVESQTNDADLEELKALSFELGDEGQAVGEATGEASGAEEPRCHALHGSATRRDGEAKGRLGLPSRAREAGTKPNVEAAFLSPRCGLGRSPRSVSQDERASALFQSCREEEAVSGPPAVPRPPERASPSRVCSSPAGFSPRITRAAAAGGAARRPEGRRSGRAEGDPADGEGRRVDSRHGDDRSGGWRVPSAGERSDRGATGSEGDRKEEQRGRDWERRRGRTLPIEQTTDEIDDILNTDFNNPEEAEEQRTSPPGPSSRVRTRASAWRRSPVSPQAEVLESSSSSGPSVGPLSASPGTAVDFSPCLSARPSVVASAAALFSSPSVSSAATDPNGAGLFCSAGDICAICTEELFQKDEIGTLAACAHQFCFTCISRWGGIRNYCPLCKQEFREILRHHFAVCPRWGSSPRGSEIPASASPRRIQLILDETVAVSRRVAGRPLGDDSEAAVADLLAEDQASRGASLPAPGGCQVCGRDTDWEQLLLCDGCEDGYHLYCLTPRFYAVPEGPWYCRQCCAVSTTAETSTLQTIARERTRLLSSASLSYFLNDDEGDARSRRRSQPGSRSSVSPSVPALFSSPNAVSSGPRQPLCAGDVPAGGDELGVSEGGEARVARGHPMFRGRRRGRGLTGRVRAVSRSPTGLSRSPSPAGSERTPAVSARLLHGGAPPFERFRTPTETLASYERRRGAQMAFRDQVIRLPPVTESASHVPPAGSGRGESDETGRSGDEHESSAFRRRPGRRRYLISVSSSDDESGGWRRCPPPLAQPASAGAVSAPTAVGGAVSAAAARQWLEGRARSRGARRPTRSDSEESDLEGFVVKDDEVVYSSGESVSEAETSCSDRSSLSDREEREESPRPRGQCLRHAKREQGSSRVRAAGQNSRRASGRPEEARRKRPEKWTSGEERMHGIRGQQLGDPSSVAGERSGGSRSAEPEEPRASQYFVATSRRRVRCEATDGEDGSVESRWYTKRRRPDRRRE